MHWMEEETINRLQDMGLNLGVYTIPGESEDDDEGTEEVVDE